MFYKLLSVKTGQASRMGVGQFPLFFSCFLLSVSDVERQHFYTQTPYSFRDQTTPPPPQKKKKNWSLRTRNQVKFKCLTSVTR